MEQKALHRVAQGAPLVEASEASVAVAAEAGESQFAGSTVAAVAGRAGPSGVVPPPSPPPRRAAPLLPGIAMPSLEPFPLEEPLLPVPVTTALAGMAEAMASARRNSSAVDDSEDDLESTDMGAGRGTVGRKEGELVSPPPPPPAPLPARSVLD